MKSRLCWIVLALLTNSVLCSCQPALGNAKLNASALYDPPMVTLSKGVVYPFAEGNLTGTGQVFHSDYSYQNAFLFGLKPPIPATK